jgi:hypothetical protein
LVLVLQQQEWELDILLINKSKHKQDKQHGQNQESEALLYDLTKMHQILLGYYNLQLGLPGRKFAGKVVIVSTKSSTIPNKPFDFIIIHRYSHLESHHAVE